MNTAPTEEFPEIEWYQYQFMEGDLDERSETWEMRGTGTDGKTYSGIGELHYGEIFSITEIELK